MIIVENGAQKQACSPESFILAIMTTMPPQLQQEIFKKAWEIQKGTPIQGVAIKHIITAQGMPS